LLPQRKVRVLMNPRSGRGHAVDAILRAVDAAWSAHDLEVTYQFSHDADDGRVKLRHAVADGVDTILLAGGDGMVNTLGAELVGTHVALGVIPTGSGNGFARHFGIPLSIEEAAVALASASRCAIDVGVANGRPFFVTCSMAADASVVKTFEAFPFRGILPYIFAAAYELFDYQPQPFRVLLDGREELRVANPLLFTVANLTQFGGGAQIAPQARADDGYLELVVLQKQDAGRALANVGKLFDGTIDELPGVTSRRFRHLVVERERAAVIQVDGELVQAPARVEVSLHPQRLQVLVPNGGVRS
jgi:diacylglycerol kinase (ATP)